MIMMKAAGQEASTAGPPAKLQNTIPTICACLPCCAGAFHRVECVPARSLHN
jgi:hypothetical protein